jgi:hypothetical protein
VSRRFLLVTALCFCLLLPSTAVARSSLPSRSSGDEPVPTAAAESERALPKVGFKVGPWKIQNVRWKDLRFNGGQPLTGRTDGPQDDQAIPMRPLGPDGTLVYNPTVLAQQGMKRLDTYVQTGNKHHLRQARKYADKLAELSEGGKKRRWQPHWYGLSVHQSGWVNANSQGLTLSFLARYYKITGAKKRLKQAQKLMAAFEQRPRNQRWITDVTAKRYVWFEHWPDGRNERTLNAHMNALFGIYDYWRATGDPLAEVYFLGGAKTVRDKLQRFRRKGELSRYSLSGTEGSLHYHETHIEQLRILAKMTGDKWFDKQADLFERDEDAWRAKYRGNGR